MEYNMPERLCLSSLYQIVEFNRMMQCASTITDRATFYALTTLDIYVKCAKMLRTNKSNTINYLWHIKKSTTIHNSKMSMLPTVTQEGHWYALYKKSMTKKLVFHIQESHGQESHLDMNQSRNQPYPLWYHSIRPLICINQEGHGYTSQETH